MKKFIAIFLFFFVISISAAEDRDIQLDQLFDKLKISNESLAYKIEQKIWDIWSTHPTDKKLTARLAEGSKHVRDRHLSKAIEVFTEVINIDPMWAEAWNKRATVLYMMNDYKGSQSDIDKVLEIEERHFGALAGQGLVNIKLENYEKAIESYKKAQVIYPNIKSADIMIKQIEELIKKQLI
jgi:tetratricopeptide (TPR) repeat protein